jgi:hypothetical protein
LSYLTSCTTSKSNLYLSYSLVTLLSDLDLCRLLKFHGPDLISIFHCFIRHSIVSNKNSTTNIKLSGSRFHSINQEQDVFIRTDKVPIYFTKARQLISIYRCSVAADLDLDYLERRGEHAREPRGPPPETDASPDSMDLVKVILLGAPAVGKTSIIQVSYITGLLLDTKFLMEVNCTYSALHNRSLFQFR